MEMEAESEFCEADVSSDGTDGGVWLGGTGCGGEVRSMWTGGEGDVRSMLALANSWSVVQSWRRACTRNRAQG